MNNVISAIPIPACSLLNAQVELAYSPAPDWLLVVGCWMYLVKR